MKRVKGGYALTAYATSTDFGVKEEFKVINNGGILRVDTLFGVGVDKIPVKPASIRQGEFVAVNELANTSEDAVVGLTNFMRSNKAVYSLMGVSVLFTKIVGGFNISEDKWTDDTRVSLYLPKNIIKSGKENYLVCSELSNINGVDTVIVSQQIIDSFKDSILGYLASCISDRELFIGTRAGIF